MVIYDPNERVSGFSAEVLKRLGVKEAAISIADDLDGEDISAVASKLAGMLLEQL